MSSQDEPLSTAITDIEGRAAVPLATDHRNVLVIDHPAYAPFISDAIELDRLELLEIALQRGSEVRVRVVDGAGEPVPGISVSCNSVGWGAVLGSGWNRYERPLETKKTDANGLAVFERRPRGKTEVMSMPKIGARDERALILEDGVDVDLELDAGQLTTLELVLRQSGDPLVDAKLVLSPAGDSEEIQSAAHTFTFDGKRKPFVKSETDATGRARFGTVESGWYELSVSHPTRAGETLVEVFAAPGGEPVVVDLESSVVRGRILTSQGAPVSGVQVFAFRADNETDQALDQLSYHLRWKFHLPRYFAPGVPITDRTGAFEFRGLASDVSYRVATVPPGAQELLSPSFTVEEGAEITLQDLVARSAGSVDLYIEGAPEERLVELRRLDENEGSTKPRFYGALEGRANIENLAPGRWRIRLVGSRFSPDPEEIEYVDEAIVDVRAGEPCEVRLQYSE